MSELLKLVCLPYQSFRGHEESAIVMNFKKVVCYLTTNKSIVSSREMWLLPWKASHKTIGKSDYEIEVIT